MKIKKILLIIFLMIVGVNVVNAEACDASVYGELEKAYKDLAVLSYYHSLSDKSMSIEDRKNILDKQSPVSTIMTTGRDIGEIKDDYTDDPHTSYMYLYYGVYTKGGAYNMGNSSLAYQLLGHIQCDEVKAIYNKTASNANNTIDYLWGEVAFVTEFIASKGGETTKEQFKTLEATTEISFEGLCGYLKSHKGISGFIKMALNIVTYAALALGVILGVLDFIQAIASHDDAALNKAAQKFFKRVVAIILIFLSGFIVTMIVNIVSINGVDRQNVICEEFNLGVTI